MAKDSPTKGDWVAWVGSYHDLTNNKLGEYRILIKNNRIIIYENTKIDADCKRTCS